MGNHPKISWPDTPGYTQALELLGRGLVLFAAFAFVATIIFWSLASRKPALERFGKLSLNLGGFSIFSAFVLLGWLIVNKQYQFQYVFGSTDNWLPLFKRFASLWSGQEGSFLLWAVTSSIFALAMAPRVPGYRREFSIVSGVFLAAISAIIAYESPFKLYVPPPELASVLAGKMPPDGNGLNPSLINFWMQIHPPTIFMGFGTLSALFALAVAALWNGNLTDWLKIIRPWAILSSTLLGVGLIMGGFWAYEMLNWGGFWMWDPVENAALVPWLLVIAFIHGIFVSNARGKWMIGTALFGASGLISFMYGTFLTRSGFLGDTSVHSFAKMDSSALKLLIGLGITCLVGLAIATIRRIVLLRREEASKPAAPEFGANLENAYAGAQTLLTLLALASAIGMSVPLIMSLQGQAPKIVEEHLYHRVVPWFFVPMCFLMAAAPYLSWRGLTTKALFQRLSTSFALALGTTGIGMFLLLGMPGYAAPHVAQKDAEYQGLASTITHWQNFWISTVGMPQNTRFTEMPGGFLLPTVPWILFLSFACLLGVSANLVRMIEAAKKSKTSIGSFLSHIGVMITMLGLIVSRGFETRVDTTLQAGRPASVMGYTLSLDGMTKTPLQRENEVNIKFSRDGQEMIAHPTLFYTEDPAGGEPSPTMRPHIFHYPMHDLYVTLYPMGFEATEQTEFKVGQTIGFEGYRLTYQKMTMEGQPGAMGTKFGAQMLVVTPDGNEVTVTPQFQITEDGPNYIQAEAGEFFVTLQKIDAKDKTAFIQLYHKNPIFPIDVFYKPLPGLVWWGTGIMLLGGVIAMFQRRRMLKAMNFGESAGPAEPQMPDETPEKESIGV